MLADLAQLVGSAHVLPGTEARYLEDATVVRGLRGRADAVVLPGTAEEVAAVVAWCYERDVPIVTRGGGTGYAGGAVPIDGGVVLSLERLTRVRAFDPLLWRIHVEAGLPTGELRRIVRESGLFFPPDPGAAEQSQIGGNIATNAGGPHAFKYGVTGTWVTGIEAVVPPGELITVGGPIRKDQAGYDLKHLLIGSEGTLGIITAAWLRLQPAPEVFLPVVAFYGSTARGCDAMEAVIGSGLMPAALEYLDAGTVQAAGGSFPGGVPDGAAFMVLAEADGTETEALQLRADLVEALGDHALDVRAPEGTAAVAELWRWRDGVSIAVAARRGGKVGEDIVVPFDRLGEAIEEVIEIGQRHGIEAVSWGHAGDGNMHANFLVDLASPEELERADAAAEEVFALAGQLGGSISGEHGLGWLKRGHLHLQWAPRALTLHHAVKQAFDPKGLLNPGKKV
ncbi:MAG: FAD-linked oxidase C-terminal domain-containing protein [Thermoleophilia bacterium]